jgi:hypothetical protein
MKCLNGVAPKRELAAAIAALAVLISLTNRTTALAQAEPAVEIAAPRDGDVLTGVVEIRGTVSTPFFFSASLGFTYPEVTVDQWFPIAEIVQSTSNSVLAVWDTTTISDGEYSIRLRLKGADGTVRDQVIRVQVRNYTSPPTPTPSPEPTAEAVLHVETPVVVAATPTLPRPPIETPTSFPPNPAGLTNTDLLTGLARGGSAILAVFLLWGAATLRRRA